MADITQQQIEVYLEPFRGREVHINTIIKDLELDASEAQPLRVLLCGRLREKRLTKPSGNRDGWFKVLLEIKPLKIAGVRAEDVYDFSFPRSYSDSSSFGFEDLITISEGDLIVLAGRSNAGKTTLAHNILGENAGKHQCKLMGSEVAGADGMILPKVLRRFKRMKSPHLFNGSGELNFTLLPIRADYEDYVMRDAFNIIDWIGVPKDVWTIGGILDGIKKAVGKGVAVAVLQKKRDSDYGYGGEPTEHYADVYMTIDPYGEFESRLTVGKVKEPKKRITGRMWAFKIVDFGANLADIREIDKCRKCWGRGFTKVGPCQNCNARGYIDVQPS